jgi:predicted regulator of Ras-like GTPase activity (Roadblock/LC7/MglB family)
MPRSDEAREYDAAAGFEGEVAGLGLSDVLQLNAQNRFSGCVRIRNQGRVGLIFFRDGEIAHAEMGDRVGEEAFHAVLAWPSGRFSVEPNVVAAHRTIQKSCEHLLLDAHRKLDERRAPAPAPATAPPPGTSRSSTGAVQLVRAIPGVIDAVVLTRDGKRVADDGYGTEALAGQATYLAMLGAEIGALLQAGDLRFASMECTRKQLLLFSPRTLVLGIFAQPESDVGAIDAAVRSALSTAR